MTDSNSTALRGALARAIKSHVEVNGLNGVKAAKECGVANSRMSTILRGQVDKISSDALIDVLGKFGYRLTSINGSGDGTEIVLSLDKAEGQVLPEIEKPDNFASYTVDLEAGRIVGMTVELYKDDCLAVVNSNKSDAPFEYREGNSVLKDDGVHVDGVHVMGDIKSEDEKCALNKSGEFKINQAEEGRPFEVLVGTMKDGKVISSEVVMSNELEDSDPDANQVSSYE